LSRSPPKIDSGPKQRPTVRWNVGVSCWKTAIAAVYVVSSINFSAYAKKNAFRSSWLCRRRANETCRFQGGATFVQRRRRSGREQHVRRGRRQTGQRVRGRRLQVPGAAQVGRRATRRARVDDEEAERQLGAVDAVQVENRGRRRTASSRHRSRPPPVAAAAAASADCRGPERGGPPTGHEGGGGRTRQPGVQLGQTRRVTRSSRPVLSYYQYFLLIRIISLGIFFPSPSDHG